MKYRLFLSLLFLILLTACGGAPSATAPTISVHDQATMPDSLVVISPIVNGHYVSPVQVSATFAGAKQMAIAVDGTTVFQVKSSTISISQPLSVGNHVITVKGQPAHGPWLNRNFNVAIAPDLQITTSSLPPATCTSDEQGNWSPEPYSAALQASGGWPPYHFHDLTTNVPGLTLADDGTISGPIDCQVLAVYLQVKQMRNYRFQFPVTLIAKR